MSTKIIIFSTLLTISSSNKKCPKSQTTVYFRYLFLTSFSASPGSRSNQSLGIGDALFIPNIVAMSSLYSLINHFQYGAIILFSFVIFHRGIDLTVILVLDPLIISVFITETAQTKCLLVQYTYSLPYFHWLLYTGSLLNTVVGEEHTNGQHHENDLSCPHCSVQNGH